MGQRWFWGLSVGLSALIGGLAFVWPPVLWALVIVGPLFLLGVRDTFQRRHTVLRNFPVLGHGRYLFESVRPEIQQYFIESNIDAYPVSREMRALVYERAKDQLQTQPFGTQRDVYRVGYEWASHSLGPRRALDCEPRVRIGGPQCDRPYSASLLNVSAMSFGSISKNAVLALNHAAREGGFYHNTGEGGLSRYHLEPGGDLVWQIGTAYFGCRTDDGHFDPEQFRDRAAHDSVKMIELKLSQGAKPGYGGVLPGIKVDREIAEARGVPEGETCISPPAHSTFSNPFEMMEFIARLRELAGGRPVGFKLCVGRRTDFFAVCKAMLETEILPDFITVDGGEGGTGAAPIEFSNSIGMPGRDAWVFVHSALLGVGLRDRVKVIASGKILSGFHMIRALAMGADLCNSARAMMFALGCIQALRCNTNRCPTGVTTQDPALVRGLHVGDKSERVRRFHEATVEGFLELLGSMGLESPDQIEPHHVYRRVDDLRVRHFGELYDFLESGQLLDDCEVPAGLRAEWHQADPGRFGLEPESGQHGGEERRR